MSFATHGGYHLFSVLDERSSGYFALGVARRLNAPVALVCTSGTATANYHPAVMEALQSQVPLILITADRPPELQFVGANQTIAQSGMFGSHVRFAVEMPVPDGSAVAEQHAAATAWRIASQAQLAPRGPVHINWPFRDPLVPVDRSPEQSIHTVRRGGLRQLQIGTSEPTVATVNRLVADLRAAKRPLLVCGPQESLALAGMLLSLAATINAPLIADSLSQVRTRPSSEIGSACVVDAYDWFVQPGLENLAAADCVIRFGRTPTSKGLNQYLQGLAGAVQWVVSDVAAWSDPGFVATDVCIADPGALCSALLRQVVHGRAAGQEEETLRSTQLWTQQWRSVNYDVAALAADYAMLTAEVAGPRGSETLETAFEGRIWQELLAVVPAGCNIFVGNSMPVRDFDGFLCTSRLQDQLELRVFANRGVSGIDGVISSAAGTAAAHNEPTLLVIGDVSFFHDSNGLLAAAQANVPLVVVIVHNDGGGIFRALAPAQHPETFSYFETRHGLDYRGIANSYGATFVEPSTWAAVRQAAEEGFSRQALTVLQIRTSAQWSTEVRQNLRAAATKLVSERWQA